MFRNQVSGYVLKLLLCLDRLIDFYFFKEALRKLGINFITAGIIGVFINHIAGYDLHVMQSAAIFISIAGIICLALGLKRGKQ